MKEFRERALGHIIEKDLAEAVWLKHNGEWRRRKG